MVANQKWSNPQGNKQTTNKRNRKPKAKPFQNEMDLHLSPTQAKNFKSDGGKSHCKQLDFVKLSWEDPTPLGSICNLKKKKRQLFYMDIETQLKSNICQLVNTGKQSWQKEKKKGERKGKEKKSKYCKLRSTPRSCIWHSSYKTRVYVGIEFS